MFFKKMLRDINERRGAYIASTILIVMGLMIYVCYSMVSDNLHIARDNFYRNQNFADGFADVGAIPRAQVGKLASVQGINQIQGRLVKDVLVLFPNRNDSVYLRLISINPEAEDTINNPLLSQGRKLENNKMNIWLDNSFFNANNLGLNKQISVIIQGKKTNFNIAGIGNSPEFVYALHNSTDIYPDPKTFGIAFVPYDTMSALFAEGDDYNNIVFTLKPGVKYKKVEAALKMELKEYGLKWIYPKKDQVSNLILEQEFQSIDATAKSLPLLFLSISTTILYLMLKRLVEQQRGQIGTLKAFGYTNREILTHYMSYALTIGLVGGILGGLLGIWLSFPYTAMYRQFFNIPGLSSSFSLTYFLEGIVLSLLFATFAGYQGCKKTLALEPAEAMRPPSPPSGKKTMIENVTFFWNGLTVQGKMATRNMMRNKGRSLFIFLGIVFTFVLSILPWSAKGLVDKLTIDQYSKVQTYDVKMSFVKPQNQIDAERELYSIKGVNRIESELEVPATLQNKWYKKDVEALGLMKDGYLYNILDKNDNKVTIPENGIMLSERLAQLLNVKIGSKIDISSSLMKFSDKSKKIEVVGIIPQYIGINAYMELGTLQRLLDQGSISTSVLMKVDPRSVQNLKNLYSKKSSISGIIENAQAKKQVNEMMASYSFIYYILALVGMVTGFAIIYSSSVTTLSERSRDLATMLVLGMTPKEVLSVITFEQWFISIFAMMAGVPFSKLMFIGLSAVVSSDAYSLPTTLTTTSIILAFITAVVSIWFAQKMVGRKINKLDIVEVLKARD